MASDRWRLLSRIYNDACRLPAGARDAFIQDACAGDAELEREVRSLVAQPSSDSVFAAMLQQGSAAALDAARPPRPSRIGRLEVRALLGAGGMGEVYHAHDASLGRDVALKLLPAAFTRDAERLVRFEREARILAALSHPNIAAIYGVEEIADEGAEGRRRALVLELVDGDTLEDRLRRIRLPIDETIDVARQIADGLEAAHEKGIVHRDLKPANIKIRADGVVKILDFGLAKAIGQGLTNGGAAERGDASLETANGAIVGTPAYMSPEQARAGIVDKRTDTWAFGCVLFEMLTGRRAFRGDSAADTIAAVLDREPDWSLLPPATPAGVRRVLHRCLEKNPRRRLRDMGDARLELEDDGVAEPGPVRRRRFGAVRWAVLGAAGVAAAFLISWRGPGRDLEPVRFTLDAPQGLTVVGAPVPSPDGRLLVFTGRSALGATSLWLRAVDATVSQPIPGTEGGSGPFWSPDGRYVGFSVDNLLKRTAIAGGPVQRITELDPLTMGATWSQDDVVVFTHSNQAPLYRVAAGGGTAEPLTTLNRERGENSHRWPQFLPDGRHFIFTARSGLPQNTAIYVASLDDPQSPKRLVTAQSAGVFVDPGYLLFVRDDTLLAQRFDLSALALTGSATAIAGNVGVFAASTDGSVVTYNPVPMRRLVWRHRSGAELSVVSAKGRFSQIRLSPDGTQAAVVTVDDGGRDIWVVALADGRITRVTSHPASDWFPSWSPDGSEIMFASDRNSTHAFYAARAAGGGDERHIYTNPQPNLLAPTDWSRDGQFVLVHSYPRQDIGLIPLAAPGTPIPLVSSPFADWLASFSPDGRWIAYVSDESRRDEVYVRALNDPARYRVSIDGGTQPRWRGDGRELFFIGSGDRLFAARVTAAGTTFHADAPVPLFEACPAAPGEERSPFLYRYDVSADGARSLWTCPESEAPRPTVAINAVAALPIR